MERSTILNGKIHYFYGHFPLLFVSSPGGIILGLAGRTAFKLLLMTQQNQLPMARRHVSRHHTRWCWFGPQSPVVILLGGIYMDCGWLWIIVAILFLICLGIRWIYHLSAVEVKPSAECQQTQRQSCLLTPSLQTHELTDLRSGWWFQPCFMFHNIWDNPSHCLYIIFFRGVELKPPTSRLFQRSSWVMPSRPSSGWLGHGELLTKKTPGAPPKSWAFAGIISDISE